MELETNKGVGGGGGIAALSTPLLIKAPNCVSSHSTDPDRPFIEADSNGDFHKAITPGGSYDSTTHIWGIAGENHIDLHGDDYK